MADRDLRDHPRIAQRGSQADVVAGTGPQRCRGMMEQQPAPVAGRGVEIQTAARSFRQSVFLRAR